MIYSFSILKQKLMYNFHVIQIYGTELNLNILLPRILFYIHLSKNQLKFYLSAYHKLICLIGLTYFTVNVS